MKHITLIVTLSISVTLIGCGKSGISVVPVTGTVTFSGKPLGEALVTFLPDNGSTSDRGASATTAEDGTFSLITLNAKGNGAVQGTYIVLIEKSVAGEWKPNTPAPEFKLITPPQYAKRETSPLKVEVKKSKNHFVFDVVP